MPNTGLAAIHWIYFGLWRHVQQSVEGAQIYHETKAGSKGTFCVDFLCILIHFIPTPSSLIKPTTTTATKTNSDPPNPIQSLPPDSFCYPIVPFHSHNSNSSLWFNRN